MRAKRLAEQARGHVFEVSAGTGRNSAYYDLEEGEGFDVCGSEWSYDRSGTEDMEYAAPRVQELFILHAIHYGSTPSDHSTKSRLHDRTTDNGNFGPHPTQQQHFHI